MTDTPQHIVFRLPPQIALTPVNFTVQVVALKLSQHRLPPVFTFQKAILCL
ncbi:TPA: hypothetical protein ACJGT4_003176 [Salmonella enterica subsp. enterica]|nr:hypothetical protein [Salmonella enterica]MCU7100281.1 hypothetical protein [Salmonella enterica]